MTWLEPSRCIYDHPKAFYGKKHCVIKMKPKSEVTHMLLKKKLRGKQSQTFLHSQNNNRDFEKDFLDHKQSSKIKFPLKV